MEQDKIGAFIAQCRREAGYTQAALGEKLGISDRAVSKWETGKNMPDASERLDPEGYQQKAEEHLLELQRLEAVKNRALLSLELVIALSATVTYLVMLFAAIFAVENIWWRMVLILVGGAFLVVGIAWALRVEHDAGYYECPHCQYRYVPTMKAVVLAPHIGRDRRMKCPRCGKKGYHKKVLTK